MGTVPRVIGFGAMASRVTAASGRTGDGTGLEVAEFGNLPEQSGSVVHKCRQRVWHGGLLIFKYYIL
jgi:hypothetical protein